MVIREVEIGQLGELKQLHIEQATAPLDGMWLTGFVPMCPHFGIYEGAALLGYFCVNGDGYLLQFCLAPEQRKRGAELFGLALAYEPIPGEPIHGAFASTAEPFYFSLCLDQFEKFEVNALMYQLDEADATESILEPVQSEQLGDLVAFANEAIGAPKEWLTGYFDNLIKRRELFCVWDNGHVIASGECRGYDAYQTDYADLGMIVAESERGKGLATIVLKELVTIAGAKGLKPICSTEAGNMAAQKAITRAGFVAPHRIVQFDAQAELLNSVVG